MADSRRLAELGMVPPLAKEVASQITAGVGNARRLVELSMVPVLAREVAAQITAKVGDVRRLVELTMVPVLAKEVAAQIQSGGGLPTPLPSFATANFIGDSITARQLASSPELAWTNLVSAAKSAVQTNLGAPGTVLQNSNGAEGTPLSNNGYSRILGGALTGANKKAMAFIAYGFNDARYVVANDSFNVAGFVRDLRASIDYLKANGVSETEICIVTPYWISDIGLNTGGGGFSGQTRIGFERFLDASKRVAREYGTYIADTYTPMKSAADVGQVIISADNIHPNDLGHQIIATAVLAATRLPATGDVTAPTILSPSSSNVAQGSAFSMVLQADEPVTWTKTGGSGSASFTLSGNVLTAPNNLAVAAYPVILTATDGAGLSSSFTYTLTVVAAASGVFSSDTFTDVDGTAITDHTGEVGASWQLQTGSSPATPDLISNNRVYCTSTASIYFASGSAADGNMEVKGIFDRLTSLGTDRVAVTARASSSANTFYWFGYDQGTGYRLFSVVSGTQVQVGSTVAGTWLSGETRELVLRAVGDQITGLVDGVAVIGPITNTAIPPTAGQRSGRRSASAKAANTGIQQTFHEGKNVS